MSMDNRLTAGAIKAMFEEEEFEFPVLQILSIKLIQSGGHNRYRVKVSDGKYMTASSMLATQLNSLVNTELKPFSIFQSERHICNVVNDSKKVLIFLDIKVITPGDQVNVQIGSPIPYDAQTGATNNSSDVQVNTNSSLNRGQVNGNQRPMPSNVPAGIHPIASLTPYQNKWTICARVTNKPAIRTWSNSRGQGKLFSMDLLDTSGEIRATAFNEQCDKFYNMIEIDKVYYISQAQLKTANKQYSSLKNDYEMTFNQGTTVTLCQEQTTIPAMQFQFVSIEQLESVEKDRTVDVIGVCKETEEVVTLTSKNTGKEIKKRDIQIVDESGKEIRLTLWGTEAEEFDGSQNLIIAAKGVKVSDFNGKSLSVLSSTTVQINPDITEAHRLRAWFDKEGSSLQTVNLSNQRGGIGGVGGNFKTIGESVAENLGCGDASDYYSAKAIPSLIRKENCLYTACPSDGCNKKVIDMSNGVYRCEKCNKEYDSFNWRLMLQASLADGTDSVWVTMFQDQAEILLGCTSEKLGTMKDNDETGFHAIINEASFKEYTFKFRVKMETFNDEKRLKTSVVAVQPLNCKEYNKRLLDQIKSMVGISS